MAPVLEVKDLNVTFDRRGRPVHAVNGISYSVDPGQTLAIIGESGSGKTVSSRAVMGILPETATVSGSIRLEGHELLGLSDRALRRYRATGLATVFQDPTRSLNPTMRIGVQVAEAMLVYGLADRKSAKERAIDLLQLVRLPAPARRYYDYPHQLSGGMRQRVMIAIALSCQPKVLIADEATTALDVTTQAQIMELLLDLQEQMHMAVVMISHNLGLAAAYADQVLVMYGGKIIEQGRVEDLFDHVRVPYTQLLLQAIPRISRPAHGALPKTPGSPPDLRFLPQGCAFAPRCPKAQDKCRSAIPPLDIEETGHGYACWYPVMGEAPV